MKFILLLISLFAVGHGLKKISIKPVDEPIDAQPVIEPANPPVDAVSSDQDLGAPPANAPPKPSDDLLPNAGAAPSNEQLVTRRGDAASSSRQRFPPGYPGFYYPRYEYYWCWTRLGWRMCTRLVPTYYPHYPPFYPYYPYPQPYPFGNGAVGGFRQAEVQP